MDTNTIINKLSLKEKLLNLFILGFNSNSEFENIKSLSTQGLGGVIFFAENLSSRHEFVNLVNNLQEKREIPLFISVDQEGGLVERTIKLDKKIKYLTPLSCSKLSESDFENHYDIMSKDLNSLGFNLNFAPCCDVNTQKYNPIIGVRAFSTNTQKVKLLSKICSKVFQENGIIPVLKHFPGHGASTIDSHIDMPTIDLSLEELEKNHIEAFKQPADMIMIAHAFYPCFDKEKTPASLSKNIISYLRNKLKFNGVIITDDMVMGGILKHYNPVDACIKALNAGVDMFIFRNTDEKLMQTIEALYQKTKQGEVKEKRINEAISKVLKLKRKQKIKTAFDFDKAQKKIDDLALKTIEKQGKTFLYKGETLIISPDKNQIFNLSFDNAKLSDYIKADEIHYDLDFNDDFCLFIKQKQKQYENIIFIGYDALLHKNQQKLAQNLNSYIAISIGINENIECFNNAKGIIVANGYNEPMIKALASSFQAI